MKINTQELTGPALNYAVCVGLGHLVNEREDPWRPDGALWVEQPNRIGWVNFLSECQGVEFSTDPPRRGRSSGGNA